VKTCSAYALTALTGLVYRDMPNSLDHTYNNGEPLISGVTIQLIKSWSVIATTVTDTDGNYNFTGLQIGCYDVTYTTWYAPLSGWSVNPWTQWWTQSWFFTIEQICLSPGPISVANNFWLVLPLNLAWRTYWDADWNSWINISDTMLSGILVTITNSWWYTASTTSDSNWYFYFTGLAPDTYNVAYNWFGWFDTYSSKAWTINSVVDWIGSLDGWTNNLIIHSISLSWDSINNDFGLVKPATLSGCVYLDQWLLLNKTLDWGDIMQPNIPVTLIGTTILWTPVTFNTTTASDGCYLFTGLVPGNYDVSYTNTTPYLLWSSNTGTINTVEVGTATSLTQLQSITLNNWDASVANNFGLRTEFDLTITKQIVTPNPRSGQPIDYLLTYYNSGEARSNVYISDTFSTLITYSGVLTATPTIPSPSIVWNTITWSWITIGANETGTILVQFVIKTGLNDDQVINTGEVGSDWGIKTEINTGNNTWVVHTWLLSTLCGKVYVDNAEDDIYNATDILYSGLTVYLKAGSTTLQTKTTATNGSYCFTGLLTGMYTVTYDPPTEYLPIDALTGTVDGLLRGIHQDLITLSNIILYAWEDSVMNDFTLTPRRPDLWVIKQVDKTRYFSGDTVVWTITYGNSWDIDAPNVVLTDLWGDKWWPETTTWWSLGTLAPGQTGQVTITWEVYWFPLETWTNTVVITTPRIEYSTGNNIFTGDFPLTWPEDITIAWCIYYDLDWSHNQNPAETTMLSGVDVSLTGIDNFMRPVDMRTQTDQLGCYSFLMSGTLAVLTKVTMETGYASPITYKPWTSHAGNLTWVTIWQGREQDNVIDPTIIKDILLIRWDNSVKNDFGVALPDLTTKIVCSPRVSYPQDPYECTVTVTNNSPFAVENITSTTQVMPWVTVDNKPGYCHITQASILDPQVMVCGDNQLDLGTWETKTYTFKWIIPQNAVRWQFFVFPTVVATSSTETRYDNNDWVDQIGVHYRPACVRSWCEWTTYTPPTEPEKPKPEPIKEIPKQIIEIILPEPIKEVLSYLDTQKTLHPIAIRLPDTWVSE
jgi:Domain of unknown function DUF11/SdrD B-like domain